MGTMLMGGQRKIAGHPTKGSTYYGKNDVQSTANERRASVRAASNTLCEFRGAYTQFLRLKKAG